MKERISSKRRLMERGASQSSLLSAKDELPPWPQVTDKTKSERSEFPDISFESNEVAMELLVSFPAFRAAIETQNDILNTSSSSLVPYDFVLDFESDNEDETNEWSAKKREKERQRRDSNTNLNPRRPRHSESSSISLSSQNMHRSDTTKSRPRHSTLHRSFSERSLGRHGKNRKMALISPHPRDANKPKDTQRSLHLSFSQLSLISASGSENSSHMTESLLESPYRSDARGVTCTMALAKRLSERGLQVPNEKVAAHPRRSFNFKMTPRRSESQRSLVAKERKGNHDNDDVKGSNLTFDFSDSFVVLMNNGTD